MLFRASVVALSALMVMPLPAAGQLVEGARVRVTLDGTLTDDGSVKSGAPQSVVARFTGMEPGHLRLAVDDAKTIRVPKASITQLEVRRRSRPRGALIGAGGGLLSGAIAGTLLTALCASDPDESACGLLLIAGVVIGFPVGTIAGVAIGVPRWVRVPPTSFALRGNPAASGVQISHTFRF